MQTTSSYIHPRQNNEHTFVFYSFTKQDSVFKACICVSENAVGWKICLQTIFFDAMNYHHRWQVQIQILSVFLRRDCLYGRRLDDEIRNFYVLLQIRIAQLVR